MLFTIQVPKKDAAEFTPSGALIFDLYATGVGVYPYTLADGQTVYEYKSLDEVAKPGSLATIQGAFLTIYHPPQFLDGANWKPFSVGYFLDKGTMDGRRVKTRAMAWDPKAIDGILSGQFSEVSMGYWQEPVVQSGQFEDQAYTILQTNMIYNHGSLYEPGGGRLGPTIGPSLDGKHWRQHAPYRQVQNNSQKEKKTMIIDFGGKGIDIPDALAPQVQAALKTITDARDAAIGEAAALKAASTQQDQAAAAAQLEEKIQQAADARLALQTKAAPFLKDGYDFKGKTNQQIMVDALATMNVQIRDGASEVELSAAFNTAVSLMNPTKSTDKSPVDALLQNIGRTDSRGAGYIPPHKRTDGQFEDANVELSKMNAYFNSPRRLAAAGGGK